MLERDVRLQRLEKLRELGVNPYPAGRYSFQSIASLRADFEKLNGKEVTTAGRVFGIREHGKVFFADLKEQIEKIQLYVKKGILDDESFERAKLIDMGDFILISGELTKTKTGEITIVVKEWSLLAKSIMPLPEKWHGLQDAETRYRQRYLDLIASDDVKKTFMARSKIVRLIRNYLQERGFMEVETPMMQPIYGGAAARPFTTHHNALDIDLYLRIAPELYLKRLIVGGFEKVFELNRNFRNEGISNRHNPEFTMLELYEAYGDYNSMMELTEQLLNTLVKELHGAETIEYQGKTISFALPFKRLKYKELFRQEAGIDISNNTDILDMAEKLGVAIENRSYLKIADDIFEKKVLPKLTDPTFVIEYPVEISPLAKQKEDNPSVTERFELFISSMEIANAFTELNDPVEQRRRFERQLAEKEEGLEKIDEDFLAALDHGMPPTGGLGIGIDRVTMILTNQSSIREVILFPLQRPK